MPVDELPLLGQTDPGNLKLQLEASVDLQALAPLETVPLAQ